MTPEACTIYLIRHAESELNLRRDIVNGRSNDIDITALGESQATALGNYLGQQSMTPDRAAASPARRAQRTAEITLRAMGLHAPFETDNDLQELDAGDFTSQNRASVYTAEELRKMARFSKDYAPPNGETMNQVANRMLHAVKTYGQVAGPNSTVLLFGHGLATRCLVGKLLGWSLAETREDRTPNTSLTKLAYSSGDLQVAYLGQTPHLTS